MGAESLSIREGGEMSARRSRGGWCEQVSWEFIRGVQEEKTSCGQRPCGRSALPGGEVAEKVDIFEITGDAFNRRPMCHIARVVLFFFFLLQIQGFSYCSFDWPNESLCLFACSQ